MIYDIRDDSEGNVTEIKFDHWGETLIKNEYGLSYSKDKLVCLCNWEDFDNFIKACYKARELWEPKE